MKGRLILVSNRAPYVFSESAAGEEMVRSVGGLVAALEPLMEANGGVWVAWGGRRASTPPARSRRRKVISAESGSHYVLRETVLTEEELRCYYYGFANSALWPLCHYFVGRCQFEQEHWNNYVRVNAKFAASAQAELRQGDLIWIHDYHLALVPEFLRRTHPDLRIAFFWHIPFPQVDVLAVLPWAREILSGLLGSDVLGFHLREYGENFLTCAEKLLGAEVDREKLLVSWRGRTVRVQAAPIGVDYQAFQRLARRPRVQARAAEIRRRLGTPLVALSADRLDYTKGILERILALEILLERYPEYRGRLTFVQVAAPSRTALPEYQKMRRQIEEAVGRVNGRFGSEEYTPVRYYYRSLGREELVSYYQAADVAVITPLRDGLNLVAKEYVAARLDDEGVLVLSRFAGAASQLSEAILVNPYNPLETAEKWAEACALPLEERRARMAALRENVRRYDLQWWLKEFWRAVAEDGLQAGEEEALTERHRERDKTADRASGRSYY